MNKTFFKNHSGSIALGLSDAIVELTGVLAGLTLTLEKTKIIGAVGLITGISASLSMAASAFLSSQEEGKRTPIFSGAITGIAYIITVLVLVSPYFVFSNTFLSLACSFVMSLSIIFFFHYRISRKKKIPFRKRFAQMAMITLGVAGVSFFIGYLVNLYIRLVAK